METKARILLVLNPVRCWKLIAATEHWLDVVRQCGIREGSPAKKVEDILYGK